MQIKSLTNYFHTVIRQKDKQADILQSLQMTAIPNTSFTTLQKWYKWWKRNLAVKYHNRKTWARKTWNYLQKSIQGFFKAPNWLTIAKADETLMTKSVSNERFNDFYNEIHACTAEYSGNNLKNCLNHINLEQEK